jgi:hypothetical protein
MKRLLASALCLFSTAAYAEMPMLYGLTARTGGSAEFTLNGPLEMCAKGQGPAEMAAWALFPSGVTLRLSYAFPRSHTAKIEKLSDKVAIFDQEFQKDKGLELDYTGSVLRLEAGFPLAPGMVLVPLAAVERRSIDVKLVSSQNQSGSTAGTNDKRAERSIRSTVIGGGGMFFVPTEYGLVQGKALGFQNGFLLDGSIAASWLGPEMVALGYRLRQATSDAGTIKISGPYVEIGLRW